MSLSVNLPWQGFVAPSLPVLAAELGRQWPGVAARFECGDVWLFADVEVEADEMRPAAVAHAMVVYLKPLWDLLEGYGVGLEVGVGGCTWQWGAAEVAGIGVDAPAAAWLAAARFLAPDE